MHRCRKLMMNVSASAVVATVLAGVATAAESQPAPATASAQTPMVTATARQVAIEALEAVSDEVAAANSGPNDTRRARMRAAHQKLMGLAALDAIGGQSGYMIGLSETVVESWPRVLAYYVGRWDTKRVIVSNEGANNAEAILQADSDDPNRPVWIEIRLQRRAGGAWGVSQMGFRADLARRMAAPQAPATPVSTQRDDAPR